MRGVIGRELAEQEAARADVALERRVTAWIADVETGAEHRDGRAVHLECATVGHRVHSSRQAADDGGARARERGRQLPRHALGIGGRAPRADYGHRRPVEEREITTRPESARRVWTVLERGRVSWIAGVQ